jgi:hypothetical protein
MAINDIETMVELLWNQLWVNILTLFYLVISTAFWKKHNLCACLGKILRLAGGSGKDWRVNMSGWSVCFFPVNPSIFA